MAPVEVDFCFEKPNRILQTVRERIVKRADFLRTKFLAPAKVLIVCDTEDSAGSVIVGNSTYAEVWLFQDDGDGKGKRVKTRKPIKFSGDQEVVVWGTRKRREIYLRHTRDNDYQPKQLPGAKQPIKV